MALNNFGLGFLITARDQASRVFKRTATNMGLLEAASERSNATMLKGAGAVGVGLVGVLAGVGGLRTAFAAAGSAGKFQQALAGVGAVTKATRTEMDLLREAAIQAGIKTQFSPDEAVDGLRNLATAGLDAREATETLIPVLDLAAGSLGQLGVGEAAAAVVGTLKSYSLATTEAGNVTDRLLRITQLTNFQAADFANGLSVAAASGATFKQELDTVLVTMGLMRNANVNASRAATAFREATRRLGSDQKSQQLITEAGVNIFDETTGKMRQLDQILLDLANKTQNMTDKERNAIVARALGARGLIAFNSIANATASRVLPDGTRETLKGAAAVAELRKQLGSATGVAEEFREKLLDNFEGQKTLFRGTIATMGKVFGGPFAKAFAPAVKTLTDFLNTATKAFESLSEGTKNGLAMGFVMASIASIIVGLGAVIGGLTVLLAPFIGAIVAGMGIALKVTAAFAAAVAALMVVWEVVGPFVMQVMDGIKDAALQIWDALQPVFGFIVSAGRDVMRVLREIGSIFGENSALGRVLAKIITGLFTILGSATVAVIVAPFVALAAILKTISFAVKGIMSLIDALFIGLIKLAKVLPDSLLAKVGLDSSDLDSLESSAVGRIESRFAPQPESPVAERASPTTDLASAEGNAAASLANAQTDFLAALDSRDNATDTKPIQVNTTVELDGREIGRAVSKHNRNEAVGGFSAVGVGA